jgi:hypothetical protein
VKTGELCTLVCLEFIIIMVLIQQSLKLYFKLALWALYKSIFIQMLKDNFIKIIPK